MSKHAPEPLCPSCGEDRLDMVAATNDAKRVTWHCSTCGRSWRTDRDVRDVNGTQMEGGATGP